MPSSGFQKCRSEEHTSELQSHDNLVCRLLLEKKKIRSEEHTSELQSHDNIVCRLLLVNRERMRDGGGPRTRGFITAMRGASVTKLAADYVAFFFNFAPTPEVFAVPAPHVPRI